MKKNRFLSRALSTTMLASSFAGALAVSAPDAHAAVPTPFERCQSGAAPDIVESVFHAGIKTQVTFPSATPDPDNGFYPGDVVKVTVTGKLRYDTVNIAGPNGVGTPDVNGIRPYSSTAWRGHSVSGRGHASTLRSAPKSRRIELRQGAPDRREDDVLINNVTITVSARFWCWPGRVIMRHFRGRVCRWQLTRHHVMGCSPRAVRDTRIAGGADLCPYRAIRTV